MVKYDSHKDSGVDWLESVPEHWEISKLKYLGDLFGGLTGKTGVDFNNDENPKNKPYIPYTNILNNTYISKDHFHYVSINEGEEQNLVKKNDMFFLMSSETYKDLGKSCILVEDVDELYLNSFCKGYRIKNKNIFPLFLNYQIIGHLHRELISTEGKGFTRINLRQDKINDLVVFYPPIQEQHQIVQYLDTKTNQVDTLIEKTQEKINLLREKRTSLINHTVTKGLNPHVEMKDSGVEWIGKIPGHWKVGKLNYHSVRIGDGIHSTPEYVDESEYSFINGNNLVDGQIQIFDTTKHVSREEYEKYYIDLDENTILLSINGTIGNLSFYRGEKVILGKSSCYIKLKYSIDKRFVFYLLKSESVYNYFNFELTGSTIFNLSLNTVRKTPIPLPQLHEQHQIIEYLDEQTQLIDTLIQKEEKRIELLKEYRQSLISDVVTGKIKVTDHE